MPSLDLSELNIILSILGAFIILYGLISIKIKRKWYLGEALPAVAVGILLGPIAAKWIDASTFGKGGDDHQYIPIALGLTRVMIGVQLVIAGYQLPAMYQLTRWKEMLICLLPIMTIMWLCSTACVMAVTPKITLLAALVIASCVTCTDPILSQAIAKGPFADKFVPRALREIISSEAGANDGFGFPFLMLATYLIRYANVPHAGKHLAEQVGAVGAVPAVGAVGVVGAVPAVIPTISSLVSAAPTVAPVADIIANMSLPLVNSSTRSLAEMTRPLTTSLAGTLISSASQLLTSASASASATSTAVLSGGAAVVTSAPGITSFGGTPIMARAAGIGRLGGGLGPAMRDWFLETWLYIVFLSIVYGVVLGYGGMRLIKYCLHRKWIDEESYVLFPTALGLFTVGTCGAIGTDDLLACFFVGNALNWDGEYLLEIERRHDEVNNCIDVLLNFGGFMFIGAIMPWHKFHDPAGTGLTWGRLVGLGWLIIFFRRIPSILLTYKAMPKVCRNIKEALFMGYFGPIGAGAVFYFTHTVHHLFPALGEGDEEETNLVRAIEPIVMWLVLFSIVVHGLSIPALNMVYAYLGVKPIREDAVEVKRYSAQIATPENAVDEGPDAYLAFNRFSRPHFDTTELPLVRDDKPIHKQEYPHVVRAITPSRQ